MNPTSNLSASLRRATRRLGLNRLIANLMSRGGYEDRFGPSLEQEIKVGDVVWDVGANVGLYTTVFLEKVGPTGIVVAFEPTQDCFAKLAQQCQSASNAVLKNIAMGAKDGVLGMSVDVDPLAATHKIVNADQSGPGVVQVSVRSGESFASEHCHLFPNVIKIDVEGHEGDVISGLAPILSDTRIRCIGVEVHFGILDQRNERATPRNIVCILSTRGFTVVWTDPSHFIATKTF